MVPRANIVIYISTVNTTTDWNNAFARAVSDGCDVITHSWGTDEAYGYGDFLSSSLSSAIAQGTTVLCSSGDYGSEGSSVAGVLTTDYPATNADVVAVGGTVLTLNSDNTRNTEVYDVDSGGGLSTVVAIPSFQQINTLHYTPIVGGVTGSPNRLNVRGVPDISAPFMTYPLYYNGAIVDVGGTSASTPVMAGMVARFKALTGQRLGLANNLFYSNPNAFYEITSGNDLAEMNNGYAATAGWNAVTGLGAPIGSALYQILKTAAFSTYPQRTYGYRPSAGPVYPRRTNGIR
jgi:subtilase family serine protease